MYSLILWAVCFMANVVYWKLTASHSSLSCELDFHLTTTKNGIKVDRYWIKWQRERCWSRKIKSTFIWLALRYKLFRKAHNFVVNYEKSRRVKRFFHTYLSFRKMLSMLVSFCFLLFFSCLCLCLCSSIKDSSYWNCIHVWSSLLSPSVNHINGIPYE